MISDGLIIGAHAQNQVTGNAGKKLAGQEPETDRQGGVSANNRAHHLSQWNHDI